MHFPAALLPFLSIQAVFLLPVTSVPAPKGPKPAVTSVNCFRGGAGGYTGEVWGDINAWNNAIDQANTACYKLAQAYDHGSEHSFCVNGPDHNHFQYTVKKVMPGNSYALSSDECYAGLQPQVANCGEYGGSGQGANQMFEYTAQPIPHKCSAGDSY